MTARPDASSGDGTLRDEARRSRVIAFTALPMLGLVVGAAVALSAIGRSVSEVDSCSSSAYTRAVGQDVLRARAGDTVAGERDDCTPRASRRVPPPAVRNLILSPLPPGDAGARYAGALGAPVAASVAGPARVLRSADVRLAVTVVVRDRYPAAWPRPPLTMLRTVLGARSFVEVRVRRPTLGR